MLRVDLLGRDGNVLASRSARLDHRASFAGTLVIPRSCAGIECPAGETCIAGACRSERCVEPDDPACGEPECVSASDCTAPVSSCAEAQCVVGTCVMLDRGTCASGTYCDPAGGCEPLAPIEDAGTPLTSPDAGPADAGPADAGPADSGAAVDASDGGPPDAGGPPLPCASRAAGDVLCTSFEVGALPSDATPTVVGAAAALSVVADGYVGAGLELRGDAGEEASLVYTLSPALRTSPLYLRFYVWLGESLDVQDWLELAVLEWDVLSGKQFSIDIINRSSEGGVDRWGVWSSSLTMGVRYETSTTTAPLGRWVCVRAEIVTAATNGGATVTIEGEATIRAGDATFDTDYGAGLDYIRFGVRQSSRAPSPFSIRMDEIVVSTTPVSCAVD